MFDNVQGQIRYHLSAEFELEAGECVFFDKFDTGTSNWVRKGFVPKEKCTPDQLQIFLRETALASGGEAWRAITERGELLRVFSVFNLAAETLGERPLTMHPNDQFHLTMAKARLGLSLVC